MKQKTVLFLGRDFFGYEKIIKELIKTRLNYNVIYLDKSNYEYSYKNIFEKIWSNLYLKNLYKKSLKDEKISEFIINDIKKIEKKIDIIFWLRPIGTDDKLIKYIKKLNKKIIIHEWDSLSTLHGIEKYFNYFDKISTFDPLDAKKYNIDFLPNFYIKSVENKDQENEEIIYDVFTLVSYDYRFETLEKIAKYLKENNIIYKFIVYSNEKNLKSEYLEIINEPISLEENYRYIEKSKALLEIGHPMQKGLSFRAIDSLGMNKKLITNYKFIKDYDFYNKENIFIMENGDTNIPINFIKSKYKEVDEKIKRRYSTSLWIEKIFS